MRWRPLSRVVASAVVLGVTGCGGGADPERSPALASPADPSTTVGASASDDARDPGARAATTLRGTAGDDHLRGTPGRDLIDGLRGSDVIRGGAGDDELWDYSGVGTGRRLDTSVDAFHGGPGDDLIHSSHHDRVFAGPGDDTIKANYLAPGDAVHCGPGRDIVIRNNDVPHVVLTGCERVRIEYAG